MSEAANLLNREWYTELERQAATQFINLPIEFQLRGYDYNFIAKSYLNFFSSETNTREDKLNLAKKFLRFTRSINKNRAKQELGEEFFMCFEYFMENFKDLLVKQDFVHLEALGVITEAIDRSQFVEDIISVDELRRRVENLKIVQTQEEVLIAEWTEFEDEYMTLNKDRFLPQVASASNG